LLQVKERQQKSSVEILPRPVKHIRPANSRVNGGLMNEDILPASARCNETIALLHVKPLDLDDKETKSLRTSINT
jgi:hypothetical protein